MRLVNLDLFKATRKRLSINFGVFFGAPIALIMFLLLVGTGFFGAILFGLLVGGFIFVLIYLMRELTHKGVESKRKKLVLNGPSLDVRIGKGEMGVLEFLETTVVFHPLTPGGFEKEQEFVLDENMEVLFGEIVHTKIQELQYQGIKEGYVLFNTGSIHTVRQFVFFNIDNALEKVTEIFQPIRVEYE